MAVVLFSGLSTLLDLTPSHLPVLTLPLSNPPRLLIVLKGSDSKMEQKFRNKQNPGPLPLYPCIADPPGSPGPPVPLPRQQATGTSAGIGERRKHIVH